MGRYINGFAAVGCLDIRVAGVDAERVAIHRDHFSMVVVRTVIATATVTLTLTLVVIMGTVTLVMTLVVMVVLMVVDIVVSVVADALLAHVILVVILALTAARCGGYHAHDLTFNLHTQTAGVRVMRRVVRIL